MPRTSVLAATVSLFALTICLGLTGQAVGLTYVVLDLGEGFVTRTLNSSGDKIAGTLNTPGGRHVALWASGQLTDLGPGDGFLAVHGVNDNGEVLLGHEYNDYSLEYIEVYRNGGWTYVDQGRAGGINNAGDIAYSAYRDGTWYPAVWRSGQTQFLNSPNPGNAVAINQAGHVLFYAGSGWCIYTNGGSIPISLPSYVGTLVGNSATGFCDADYVVGNISTFYYGLYHTGFASIGNMAVELPFDGGRDINSAGRVLLSQSYTPLLLWDALQQQYVHYDLVPAGWQVDLAGGSGKVLTDSNQIAAYGHRTGENVYHGLFLQPAELPALPGDVDRDGACDVADLLGLVACFGEITGTPGMDWHTDLNLDGVTDVVDLLILVENFGTQL